MYNKVFLIGNLTRDPELRYTSSGIPVTRFTVAVNRIFKSEKQDVDFIRIVTWRKLAEICGEYLAKGKTVSIEGHLQIDEYERDGKKRNSSVVVAERVEILSRKDAVAQSGNFSHNNGTSLEKDGGSQDSDEEIPF